jgi:hypothetical protein
VADAVIEADSALAGSAPGRLAGGSLAHRPQ